MANSSRRICLTMSANFAEAGKYDRHLLADYSRAEFDELNDYLDHERDMTFSYGAVKQLEGKYLVQNRVSRQIYRNTAVSVYAGGDVFVCQISGKPRAWLM